MGAWQGQINIVQYQTRSHTFWESGKDEAESEWNCPEIKQDHIHSVGAARAHQSQMNIVRHQMRSHTSCGSSENMAESGRNFASSNKITYGLRKRGGPGRVSSKLSGYQTRSCTFCRSSSNYVITVRSKLCRHQTRSRTPCRNNEDPADSDPHCTASNKITYGLSERRDQIEIVQASKEITYFLSEQREWGGIRSKSFRH